MFLRIAAVLCIGVLALVRSQTTTVNTCIRHSGPLPIHVYIENCPTPPCTLPQLQNVVLHVVFRAPYTMRTMETLATAYLFGGPFGVEYDLGQEAITCNFLTNTYCPVLENEVVTYTLRMYIEAWMAAGTQATIEFRIADERGTPVVCFRVPVAIVRPVTSALDAGLQTRNVTMVVNKQ